MTDWESVLNYIFENSLIPDIILAIFYLIAFWQSFSQVYLKSYRILRKKEPPVLYSAKFSLSSTLSFSFMFLIRFIQHIVYIFLPLSTYDSSLDILYVSYTSLFNKLILLFCMIYIWSILAYFIRQLLLKSSGYLKNRYCILENTFSLFLITLGVIIISSTSTFRLDFGINNYTEQTIMNILIIFVIVGLILLSLIYKSLQNNFNTNFCNEINFLTQHDLNIRKNNFHILRITARNIEAIQIYIIAGLVSILSIYLPLIHPSSVLFLYLSYIMIGIADLLLIMQMSKICVPAITQTKLEE